jgi:hypothetical protein
VDDFAKLPRDERRLYFEQTAAQRGLSAQIIEKDFWVCWCLRRLFSLDEFHDHLTFKGGTSLSKVYKVIERFSEDVDIAIERTFLGFGGDMEPENAPSGKERKRRIEQLNEACRSIIASRLAPQLEDAIAGSIAENTKWGLTFDAADRDSQTLLFRFPPSITTNLSPYFAASVKIELGARSDHYPVEQATVTPYVTESFPDALTDDATGVRVLGAERTFWEKATILHMLHHMPASKKFAPRMSRHYYDVFQLSRSPILDKALNNMDLLDRVATHKSVFFKSAWANYESACPGTLRLVPPDGIAAELKQDYLAMQPMFFHEPPDFNAILNALQDLEVRIKIHT